jgi:hypothetical protein
MPLGKKAVSGTPITLDPASLTSIATKVVEIINTTPKEPIAPDSDKQDGYTYSDPFIKECLEAKSKIMKDMANSGPKIKYIRGQRGVTEVNETLIQLNMIDNQMKDWVDRKTHNKRF